MWHCKPTGYYSHLSTEATDNAQEIANILVGLYGWTLESACGCIGNMQFEVGLNPWCWENNNILSRSQAQTTSNGYGLIGWTPARKYQFNNAEFEYQGRMYKYFPDYNQESYPGYGPNWSDVPGNTADGAAQTRLIAEGILHSNSNLYYQRSGHVSARNYITLTDVNRAASEWWYCVEFSAHSSSIPDRQRYAREIYNWLVAHGWTPSPGGNLPMWLIMRTSQLMINGGE